MKGGNEDERKKDIAHNHVDHGYFNCASWNLYGCKTYADISINRIDPGNSFDSKWS